MPGRSEACLCMEATGIGQVSHARDAIVSFARSILLKASPGHGFEWLTRGYNNSVEVVIDFLKRQTRQAHSLS